MLNRPCVVIDTSVLIDAIAVPPRSADSHKHREAASAFDVAVRHYQPVCSTTTFNEFIGIINLKGIGNAFGRDNIHGFRNKYVGQSRFVENVTQLPSGIIADEKDKPFLELAVSSGAQCIVSSDKHFLSKKHLALAHIKPVQIWSPQQFLQYDLQRQRQLQIHRKLVP